MYRRLFALLDRWTLFSIRRSRTILAVATAFFALCIFLAMHLDLKSDFIELLPTDSPSVVNLERLKNRVASYSTLTIAIECPDLEVSKRFAEDLVARLRTFPPERIRSIDYNLKNLRDFYSENKFLYADLPDLTDFRDRLDKRIREETEQNAFESLDDAPRQKTDLKIDEIKAKYESKSKEQDKYPDGYYVTPDHSLLAVFVSPPSASSNFANNVLLVDDVQKEIAALDPTKYHAQMSVGLTGDIKTGLEERGALASDAEFVGILCMFLILGIIIVYYRSLRSVILIGTPMLIGLAAAMAVAQVFIGYLNTATAFLSSIVAGNGINFMIMLAARFFEEVHHEGPDHLEDSLKKSVRGTVQGTAVAATAAAVAYGSLVLAGFRGFRQFGIIGGSGMIFCWLATFLVGPALIAWMHRRRPLTVHKESERHPFAGFVGRIVTRHPRWILVSAMLLTAASILVTIPYSFDPFEYDFHKLRNREGAERGSAKLSRKVDTIFTLASSPTPVLIDDPKDADRVRRAILDAPGSKALVREVKTLQDLLPAQQLEKLQVLGDIRRLIDRKIDFLPADQQKDLETYRPPERLRVLGMEDVPEVMARQYTEANGTRGRLLFVYRAEGESLLDGKFLLKFAHFLRGVKVEGADLTASGQAMVFADMIDAILRDGVVVTIAAALGVLLLLIVAYRSARGLGVILMAVIVGSLWMIGFAALFDLKLNFLNFVVIPITLGISVDYGANIFSRYRMEGSGSIAHVIKSTGGAVVLSSGTTILGYASLITSTNMALQSFGIIADIGEFTTLGTAEIVMCALIVWLEQSPRAKADARTRSGSPS